MHSLYKKQFGTTAKKFGKSERVAKSFIYMDLALEGLVFLENFMSGREEILGELSLFIKSRKTDKII